MTAPALAGTMAGVSDPLAPLKQALQAGDVLACATGAEALLASANDPATTREALYLLAVARRYAGDLGAAAAAAGRLLDLAPEYGRAWQELGHIHRAAGDGAGALAAYGRAVALNPALVGAWGALAGLHRAAGQARPAAEAQAQLAWLEGLLPPLLAVENAIAEGELARAEAMVRAFLARAPRHTEAMRQLAAIGLALNVLDDAEVLLAHAHAFAPDDQRLHGEYVGALLRRQKYAAALAEAEALAARAPGHVPWQVLLGNARIGAGDFEGALAAYDAVLAQWPGAEAVHLSRGHALKTIGRQAEAVAAYRAAYGARGDFGDAYWSLANLKTYRFTAAERAAMAEALASPRVAGVDRIHLHFALAKALEDEGDYAASFAHYAKGNAMQKARLGYDPAAFDAEVAAMIAATPASLFAGLGSAAAGGCPDPAPIFILGLPRAGSTLIEQILASHSQVEGTAELPHVLAQVHALSGRDRAAAAYPANLASLPAEAFTAMGAQYLADTAPLRHGKPRFIDKMPNNFRHIGLIARMLPQARIIDARREAMACCFSGFKQLFAEGQAFSYGLEDIGRYYTGYLRLMDHWHRVLPGRILTVQHEDLLADLEGAVRRILAFCDLPFEPACLAFHETRRAVRTASSEQVRRPLDKGLGQQWRPFAPWLGPLEAHLAAAR